MQDRLDGWLAVGVSQSGRTPEIVAVLESFGAAGAVTVAVTNDRDSALAHAADATLDTAAGVERAVPATKTVTALRARCGAAVGRRRLGGAAGRDRRRPGPGRDRPRPPARPDRRLPVLTLAAGGPAADDVAQFATALRNRL